MSPKKKGSKLPAKKSKSKAKPAPSEPKRSRGAPTKYDPKYCDAIIKHAAKWCGTIQSFAISIEVHTDTLLEWAKVHKEFSVAMRRAKQIQEEVMVKAGLGGVKNSRGFGNQTWAFIMKARFGWREDAPQDQDENEVAFELE